MSIYRALSWGCGLQSTTLGVMSALGDLDRLDVIITADLGWERQATYDVRDWYVKWFAAHDVAVEIIHTGDIRKNAAKEHIHIPFFTDSGGPLRRQCTRELKIRPIRRRLRELIGYNKSNPPHPQPSSIETWLGITMDEWTRAKPSRVLYTVNRWPFLEPKLRWFREDCETYLTGHGLPIPPKSACLCCPYRRASEWLELQEESPGEWKDAVEFDEANRHNPLAARGGSTADELYIWNGPHGPEPLGEADLEAAAACERRIYASQIPMFACESGYCGV